MVVEFQKGVSHSCWSHFCGHPRKRECSIIWVSLLVSFFFNNFFAYYNVHFLCTNSVIFAKLLELCRHHYQPVSEDLHRPRWIDQVERPPILTPSLFHPQPQATVDPLSSSTDVPFLVIWYKWSFCVLVLSLSLMFFKVHRVMACISFSLTGWLAFHYPFFMWSMFKQFKHYRVILGL